MNQNIKDKLELPCDCSVCFNTGIGPTDPTFILEPHQTIKDTWSIGIKPFDVLFNLPIILNKQSLKKLQEFLNEIL